jgi:ubiquinol-cytochrome c reductase cytochrome c subunit
MRRHLLAAAGVLAVTAAVTPLAAAQEGDGDTENADQELIDQGRELYVEGCASCHGVDGTGIEIVDGGAGGPSLREAGEASAYFYLSTGRMPAAETDTTPTRKDPAYDPDEIDALVAYVASLGDGPSLPELDLESADLSLGGEVYRANCQACHSASGSGGALSYGDAAPPLGSATAEQIAAAVRTGPGQMPVFGPDLIRDRDLDDLVRYVDYLDNPEDPGGLPIGRTGPIPEGFVAWLVGMVALVGFVCWIGTRNPIREAREVAEAGEGGDDS